jgi:hypothetical protein
MYFLQDSNEFLKNPFCFRPNPSRHLSAAPNKIKVTSYHQSKSVPQPASHNHLNHINTVLVNQTRELMSAPTPDAYLKILHRQLQNMTSALHDCIDALAEERRIRDRWRAKWNKLNSKMKQSFDQQSSQYKSDLKALKESKGLIMEISNHTEDYIKPSFNNYGRAMTAPVKSNKPNSNLFDTQHRPQYKAEPSLIQSPLSVLAIPDMSKSTTQNTTSGKIPLIAQPQTSPNSTLITVSKSDAFYNKNFDIFEHDTAVKVSSTLVDHLIGPGGDAKLKGRYRELIPNMNITYVQPFENNSMAMRAERSYSANSRSKLIWSSASSTSVSIK